MLVVLEKERLRIGVGGDCEWRLALGSLKKLLDWVSLVHGLH